MTPRRAALDVLLEREKSGRWADEIVEEWLPALPEGERAFFVRLTCEAVRRERTLDHLIRVFSKRDVKRLDRRVAGALRLGIAQLLFHEGIPEYAACDETVALVKGLGARSAGFANAVLRGLLRGIESRRATEGPPSRFLRAARTLFKQDVLPLDGKNPVHAIGVRESHPDWLVARWIAAYGRAKAEALCRAGNAQLPTTIRVNRTRATTEGLRAALEAEGVKVSPGRHVWSLNVDGAGDVSRLEAFRRGEFQLQDEASLKVGALAGAAAGETVLDANAWTGAKAAQMVEAAPDARIVACASTAARVRRLEEGRSRLGHAGIWIVGGDAARPPFGETFNGAVVDAPSSNTGALSRRADARWRLRPAALHGFARRQLALLAGAAETLKKGGRLVYATASIEPEENEQVVQKFLQLRPDLKMTDCELTLPEEERAGGFYARIERP